MERVSMSCNRWWWLAAFLPLAACTNHTETLSPAAALQRASENVETALKQEAALRTPVPPEAPQKSGMPYNIDFWYFDHPMLSRAFGPRPEENAFQHSHPGVSLHPQYIGPWDLARQKLAVSLAANDMPDVALVRREMLARLIPAGRIVPLDTFLPAALLNDLHGPSREAFTVGGHLYALPADGFCQVLLYNADLIPRPPANLRDLQALATQLAPKLGPNRCAIGYLPFLPLLWSFGGHVFDGDTDFDEQAPESPACRLNSPEARKTLDFLISLKSQNLTSLRFLCNENTAFDAFGAGNAAMTVASSRMLPYMEGSPFKVGIAPVPGQNGPTSLFSDSALVVFRRYADEKHDAIVQLLDFLTGPEVQGEAAVAVGSVPVRNSVTAKVPEGLASAYAVAKGTPLHPALPRIEDALDQYLPLAYASPAPTR
jgi:ABC-type glycerol-3-phosphate transport system substrate-binding protein